VEVGQRRAGDRDRTAAGRAPRARGSPAEAASTSSSAAAPPRKVALRPGCGEPISASAAIPSKPKITGITAPRQARANGATRERISSIAGKCRARISGGAAKTSATSMPNSAGAQQRGEVDYEAAPDRQQLAERLRQQRCHQHAGDEPGERPGERRRADLQRVDAGDVAAGRAEDLERGHARPARLEVRGDAAADADPGDDQRGEADEREELAHPRDEALGAGRGAVAGADVEPGVGEALLEAASTAFGIGLPSKRTRVFDWYIAPGR
jgi:hypothetical protein